MEIPNQVKRVLRPVGRIRFVAERIKYGSEQVLTGDQGNKYIATTLRDSSPQAIAKVGAAELGGIRRFLRYQKPDGQCLNWGGHGRMLFRNAGVYPEHPVVHTKFASFYLESLRSVSVLGVWYQWGECRIAKSFAANAQYVSVDSLEPFYHSSPWSGELAGRRVLVITPFAKSVVSQYAKRELIWPGRRDILPDFQLKVIACPLSAAIVTPQDKDWFATLRRLTASMDKIEYDVVIIGAGAWSIPLAVHAKQSGKWAIHLGGGTQLLFGIKGARWDEHPRIKRFFNPSWTRPSSEETPSSNSQIEGGCYW